MRKRTITIQLIGAASDKSDVLLSDLIDRLGSIKKALRETEITLSGSDEQFLDYKVVDLRHDSPATIVVQPIPFNGVVPDELMDAVINNFAAELKNIKQKGELLIDPDLARLQAYLDIGSRQKGRIEKVKIRAGRSAVTIDEKFTKKLDQIVGPDEFAHGMIAGMLDAINIHNTNRFTIYPPLGPKRVIGTFYPNLREQVKKAIGSFVTVSGKLRYKAWSPYPHGVIAEEIDIHEPDSKLPRLSELRGAFRGATGDLNSVEFVDRLRNEDW